MDTAPDKAREEVEYVLAITRVLDHTDNLTLRSQTFSNSTDATPDLNDKTNPRRPLSQPSALAQSPESPTEHNEVTV